MKNNPETITEKKTTRNTGTIIQRLGMNMLMVGLVALLAFLAWQRFIMKQPIVLPVGAPETSDEENGGGQAVTSLASDLPVELSPLVLPTSPADGIMRKTNLKTIIPSRPRTDVITYTVQSGDTLFSVAQNFNIKPETLLWGNFEVLNDNPHLLKPKQVLNVLPVDGTYYQWHENDTLEGVAAFFKTDPQAIISFSGNNIDLTQVGKNGSGIETGAWIIVPGGKRAIKDWGPPAITRKNPASARYYGEGACGNVYEGAFGTGTFVWPTVDHSVSGYAFDPGVHPAIDIGGQEGNSVFATDSGVVVYAGWSDYGYGLLIVIDHGNGWQSAYAHLSSVAVSCGQSVYQGGFIGGLGSTGNSSGPHLHFELVINGAKVNPLDYTS